MIKSRLVIIFSAVLTLSILSSPGMASDFYALRALQGISPTAIQDSELAATEGGATCLLIVDGIVWQRATTGGFGGVCLTAFTGFFGRIANFAVANAIHVTGANFLQVIGL